MMIRESCTILMKKEKLKFAPSRLSLPSKSSLEKWPEFRMEIATEEMVFHFVVSKIKVEINLI